jgi:hypothetical protein
MSSRSAPIISNANTDNINHFTYTEPKAYKSGKGKNVRIIGGGRQYQNIQLPMMMSWGFNRNVNDKTNEVTYSISLQFPPEEERTAEQSRLLEMFKARDEKHIQTAVENSQKWFGKKMSEEVVRENYVSLLKYPKIKETDELDYTRPPSLRMKLGFYDGVFKFNLYDMESETLFNEEIQRGKDGVSQVETLLSELIPKTAHLVAIIQSNGMWFVNKNFGETFQLSQAIVKPPIRLNMNVCQIVMSSDEKQMMEKKAAEKPTVSEDDDAESTHSAPKKPDTRVESDSEEVAVVEDKDDEEEDSGDDEDEPVVAKAPEPAKTVARRRVGKK